MVPSKEAVQAAAREVKVRLGGEVWTSEAARLYGKLLRRLRLGS